MKFLIFLISFQASASLLSPIAELKCTGKVYQLEIKLNDQKLNTLLVKKKNKLVKSCSFFVSDESRTQRGSDIVKTLYTDIENCDGKTDPKSFSPGIPKGMLVFSGRGSISKAEVHHLENSNALTCKILTLDKKKIEKFSVVKK